MTERLMMYTETGQRGSHKLDCAEVRIEFGGASSAAGFKLIMVKMLVGCVILGIVVSGVFSHCQNDAISIKGLSLRALSGSCVLIPCTFTVKKGNFPGHRSATVVWKKTLPDIKYVVFNSSKTEKNYPMKVIGDLSQNNCTTVFYNLTTQHSDNYYFRAEDGDVKATAACSSIKITVTDSLPGPSITVSGEQTENTLVTITCSAVTPCPEAPPTLTWNLSQDPPHITQIHSNGTFTTEIQGKITLNHTLDGRQITCSAKYPVNGSSITVQRLTYAPKNTHVSVSPSGSLSVGQTVNLSCSSSARPSVDKYYWYKDSTQGHLHVNEGQTYSFNLTHSGHYYCVAVNSVGNETSPGVFLKIEDAADLLWKAVVGSLGLLVLICLGIFVYCKKKSKREAVKETQRQTSEGTDKAEEDTVLYANVDLSQLRSGQASGLQETVYSPVRVTERQAAPEDLYATVKK